MLFLASRGNRCIAHDRRGHGRSGQPWGGNEMNTYGDDLATLMDALDLKQVVLIGFNRPGAKPSPGMTDSFWLQGMQAGHKNAFDCIQAFSETDFTGDLKTFDLPTLVIHGDDDQIVPIGASALAAVKLLRNSTLKVYRGAPHGLTETPKEQLNSDLLVFLKAEGAAGGSVSAQGQ